MQLTNKTALVTGGGSGIGSATVDALAAEGAALVVCDIDAGAGQAVVDRVLARDGRASLVVMDVTDPEAHMTAVAEAERLFGGLDIAVNCAGISVGPSKVQRVVHETSIDEWRRVMAINVDGIFLGLVAQVPAMIRRGGGSIVNIGSVMSVVARTKLSPYVTSKHAVIGLTKAAAVDCAEHGIRVNAVGPGYIDSPLLAYKPAEVRDVYAKLHPLGRMGTPAEVAQAVVWLASSRSSFCTGSFYAVDGGYSAL